MLVLASASPRRRDLLTRLGLRFEVRAAEVDETPGTGEGPEELAGRLASAKAARVAALEPGGLVLGADTIVARRRRMFGKPSDADSAAAMLRELAGRGHRVISGVALASGIQLVSTTLTSRVRLRAFSDDDIDAYVATGDPLDKAGAYAVQNELFRPVE